MLMTLAATLVHGQSKPESKFKQRAESEYLHSQQQFQSNTNDATIGWQFARACYDMVDFATNKVQRASIAREGIAACRQVINGEPTNVAAHYYLAMDLGQLASTETLGALKIVKEIEREFKTAADLGEKFDYAGAARGLGLLYRDAPGWPISVGSRKKARQWLGQAVELSPQDPENHLNLIESRIKWSDHAGAQNELKILNQLWPSARTNFTGAAWESSWDDWTKRRDAAQQHLEDTNAPKSPVHSP